MANINIEINEELDFTQMYKLMAMLAEAKIPFKLYNFFGGFQVAYPDNSENRRCSIVLHNGSYGRQQGCLGIMGLQTEEESVFDDVAVINTAEEVFKRIKDDYDTNHL